MFTYPEGNQHQGNLGEVPELVAGCLCSNDIKN